jgi:hypothetical protein
VALKVATGHEDDNLIVIKVEEPTKNPKEDLELKENRQSCVEIDSDVKAVDIGDIEFNVH